MQFYIAILNKLKKEVDRRNQLVKHGVDLTNYENEFTQCCIDLLAHAFTKRLTFEQAKEYIEWWLFESVDKVIWDDNLVYDVNKAKDFVKYVMGE